MERLNILHASSRCISRHGIKFRVIHDAAGAVREGPSNPTVSFRRPHPSVPAGLAGAETLRIEHDHDVREEHDFEVYLSILPFVSIVRTAALRRVFVRVEVVCCPSRSVKPTVRSRCLGIPGRIRLPVPTRGRYTTLALTRGVPDERLQTRRVRKRVLQNPRVKPARHG